MIAWRRYTHAQHRSRGAVSLLAVLFLLTVIAAVLATTLTMTASDALDSSAQSRSIEALLLAESGLERQLGRLANGTACTALAPDSVPGQISLLSATLVSGQCVVRIAGTVGDVTRTVEGRLSGAGGAITADVSGSVAANAATTTLPLSVGTGANRVLVIGITADKGSGTVTALTYTTAGPPATSATPTFLGSAGTGGNPGIDIYYLVNPPSGAGNVNLTMSGAGPIVLGAQVFSGVDQATPFNASAFTTGTTKSTTPNLAITTTVANAELMDVLAVDKNVTTRTPPLGPAAGQAQIWRLPSGANITGAASRRGPLATPQTVTMSWSYGGANEKWNMGVVALQPAGTAQLVRWTEVVQ